MCEHLIDIERELKAQGFKETFRGQPWSKNCREWVYYDCYLDTKSIRNRFKLPDFVIDHSNDDPRSGLEAGLVCEQCHDAIVGAHSSQSEGKRLFGWFIFYNVILEPIADNYFFCQYYDFLFQEDLSVLLSRGVWDLICYFFSDTSYPYFFKTTI